MAALLGLRARRRAAADPLLWAQTWCPVCISVCTLPLSCRLPGAWFSGAQGLRTKWRLYGRWGRAGAVRRAWTKAVRRGGGAGANLRSSPRAAAVRAVDRRSARCGPGLEGELGGEVLV